MDENQNPNRRRSSFGLLISFLFVMSLIVTLVVLLNRNTSKTLTQQDVVRLSKLDEITILCGHFEGIDERVIDCWDFEQISIGDYVLSGGEQASLFLTDAVLRYVPGVLGNSESTNEESFSSGLLEYPQYTRPAVWNGISVPEVLTSGHHQKVCKDR